MGFSRQEYWSGVPLPSPRGKLASSRPAHPQPEAGRQAGNSQNQKARGKLGPRDGILYQTASRLPVANQVFVGSWMADIRQEGHSQRSAPQRRHTAHLRWHSQEAECLDRGGEKMHRPTWGECTGQAPGHLRCSDLGRAQNADPTKSVTLWSNREPEPEQLRSGKCTQPRARFRQFSCRVHSVRPLHHDPPVLGGPTGMA